MKMRNWTEYLNSKSDLGDKNVVIDFSSTALSKKTNIVYQATDPMNRTSLAPAYVRLYISDNGLINISWVYTFETLHNEQDQYLTGQEVAEHFRLPCPGVLFNNLEFLVKKILDWCNVLTVEVLMDDTLKRFMIDKPEWLGNLKEGYYVRV